MVIAKIWKDAQVVTFHDPMLGFEYVVNEYPKIDPANPVILLLDINMPLMDGWEFLDKFNRVLTANNDSIKDRLIIYVLSSSVDKKDIARAHLYSNVTDYLVKPITKDTISKITGLTK